MNDADASPALLQRLRQLRNDAARLKAEVPDPADFMPAFAGEADGILEDADRLGGDCWESASHMVDEILIDLGYMDAAERQT
ncbi:hypothetical protein N799_09955 [Lysobacter arseniciresistens ZS79]|uniref:Uncharacterized protein n=1 Tax=Lysobacter arseniciresistens ZS79 TaxID=913325 RepID=A0A0A0EUH2_9GAMM|nr:hypothetical protein [Lysobacter arseniciresistens]KGM54194.1 hypothetical protein N799_09955 [Lysobacter arseniciresistens ZS79]